VVSGELRAHNNVEREMGLWKPKKKEEGSRGNKKGEVSGKQNGKNQPFADTRKNKKKKKKHSPDQD